MVYIFLPRARIHAAIIFHDGFKACHYTIDIRIREYFPDRSTRPLSSSPRAEYAPPATKDTNILSNQLIDDVSV